MSSHRKHMSLVFRPQMCLGTYKGFYITIGSPNATQDYTEFDKACVEFRKLLEGLNGAKEERGTGSV
jgi:hypothetical protein